MKADCSVRLSNAFQLDNQFLVTGAGTWWQRELVVSRRDEVVSVGCEMGGTQEHSTVVPVETIEQMTVGFNVTQEGSSCYASILEENSKSVIWL